jgi:hypothetical protein
MERPLPADELFDRQGVTAPRFAERQKAALDRGYDLGFALGTPPFLVSRGQVLPGDQLAVRALYGFNGLGTLYVLVQHFRLTDKNAPPRLGS